MFKFIHTYTNESFEGLFKNGLFREGDGLKLMHKNYLPDEKSFNNYASKDSKLFSVLKNLKCPFYIDRFQGGIAFPYAYDFDKELLEEYKNLLGENFWGFQMHEWVSNYRGEIERVEEALKEFKENNKGLPESVFWKEKTENTAVFHRRTCSPQPNLGRHPVVLYGSDPLHRPIQRQTGQVEDEIPFLHLLPRPSGCYPFFESAVTKKPCQSAGLFSVFLIGLVRGIDAF